MPLIVVGGRSAASAATANHVAAQLWNPHATSRIKVSEIHIAITTAGAANIALRRSTTRGTPGSTVTPSIVNVLQRDIAGPSGVLLDLAAFSVQPTLEANSLWNWNLPAAIGAGVIRAFPDPIIIPAANGLCITTSTAVAFPASDISFVLED